MRKALLAYEIQQLNILIQQEYYLNQVHLPEELNKITS